MITIFSNLFFLYVIAFNLLHSIYNCCPCNGLVLGNLFIYKDLVRYNLREKKDQASINNILKNFLNVNGKVNLESYNTKINSNNNINETDKKRILYILDLHCNIENFNSTENNNYDNKNKFKPYTIKTTSKYSQETEAIEYKGIKIDEYKKYVSEFIKIDNVIPCIYAHKKTESNNNDQDNKKIVIFFHGNSDSILGYFDSIKNDTFRRILDIGFDLAFIEYKGGAYYNGEFSEKEFVGKDAVKIYKFFKRIYGPCFYSIGYSLGCSFSAEFTKAAEKEINKEHNSDNNTRSIGGCIMIYPFINIKQAAKHIITPTLGCCGEFMISLFLKKRFENDKTVKDIHCPLYLYNNKKDEMCDENSVYFLKNSFLNCKDEDVKGQKINDQMSSYNKDGKTCYIINSNSGSHSKIRWNDIYNILEQIANIPK